MIDISLLIAAHFVPVMVHVPSLMIPIWFPELNGRAAYLPHRHSFCNVIPYQVLPIMLPAGHHLYSYPKSVSDDVFPMKKAKIKPVI